MKALRCYGKDDLRLEEIEEPQVQPGTVKIKPALCGICGSDLHRAVPDACVPTGNERHHPAPDVRRDAAGGVRA